MNRFDRMGLAFTIGISLLLVLGACGSSNTDSTPSSASPAAEQENSASSTHGSCNKIAELGTCNDLSGDAFLLGEEMQRSMCTGLNGTYGSAACPTENLVGSCDIGGGQIRRYYSTGTLPFTGETAQQDCTGAYQGTWTAVAH
jgi:hypothetical protein